jgi:hypothetical protein
MVLNVELLFEKVLYFLWLPGLPFIEEFDQLVLFVFVEFRGPAAPETRGKGLDTPSFQLSAQRSPVGSTDRRGWRPP